jgi:hypothetical protein
MWLSLLRATLMNDHDNNTPSNDVEVHIRMGKTEIKDALKEGLKEWMDDQVTEVGRWTLRGLAAAGVVALTYFILTLNGWHVPGKTP